MTQKGDQRVYTNEDGEPCSVDGRAQLRVLRCLKSIVPKVASETRCIILFGSYARNSLTHPTKKSDIDILIIFKSNARIGLASKIIQASIIELDLDYDYLWRTEDLLYQHLKEGIDTYLYFNIFSFGDILYEEPNYVSNLKKRLIGRKWTIFDIQNTVEYRISKIVHEKRKIIHHLERIIFEMEAFKCLQARDDIANLPRFRVLLRQLLSTRNKKLKNTIEFFEKAKKHNSCYCDAAVFVQIDKFLTLVAEMYKDFMKK